MAIPEGTQRRPRGRPAVSRREDIERVAMGLFLANGYAATTIQMIADASGVSRTSVFRYWGSKAEIVWAVFDVHTQRLGALLGAADTSEATMTVVRRQVVENMRMSTEDSGLWMERFAVLDSTPELRSEESAHWTSWAGTVAAYIAARNGLSEADVVPQSIGGAVQAAFLAVLRQWLEAADPSAESLLPQLDEALRPLCALLQHWLDEPDRYS
jgi:TetR/AcrR family transcriptional regulator, regulator of mycofactocin system